MSAYATLSTLLGGAASLGALSSAQPAAKQQHRNDFSGARGLPAAGAAEPAGNHRQKSFFRVGRDCHATGVGGPSPREAGEETRRGHEAGIAAGDDYHSRSRRGYPLAGRSIEPAGEA